jgi:hypothetical protein
MNIIYNVYKILASLLNKTNSDISELMEYVFSLSHKDKENYIKELMDSYDQVVAASKEKDAVI